MIHFRKRLKIFLCSVFGFKKSYILFRFKCFRVQKDFSLFFWFHIMSDYVFDIFWVFWRKTFLDFSVLHLTGSHGLRVQKQFQIFSTMISYSNSLTNFFFLCIMVMGLNILHIFIGLLGFFCVSKKVFIYVEIIGETRSAGRVWWCVLPREHSQSDVYKLFRYIRHRRVRWRVLCSTYRVQKNTVTDVRTEPTVPLYSRFRFIIVFTGFAMTCARTGVCGTWV